MAELPELKIVEHGWAWRISPKEGDKHCLWLDKAQANEIVRRCKAYEGLVTALEKLKQASIKFQCDHCDKWLVVTVQEIIGSDRQLEKALAEVKAKTQTEKEDERIEAAQKARTGNRKDLQEYLKLRRER
ncbi:hypothetical protein LCGC14_2241480 [marine sediment metagenome]|uniref:Uncharacterized protein n=1 Tax=marine sediment metagenome TaxID=412755 RepID=A0A0F9D532_9ZZZZ